MVEGDTCCLCNRAAVLAMLEVAEEDLLVFDNRYTTGTGTMLVFDNRYTTGTGTMLVFDNRYTTGTGTMLVFDNRYCTVPLQYSTGK